MRDIKINEYLSRIKLQDCNNDFDGLIKLQQNHMQNIPFENLDVVIGREINLDSEALYKKIVLSNRGGYCFELNTIYSILLKSLGFSIKPVLGRVWLRNPQKTPPRNHMAHLVVLNGEVFLTDVGFGGLTSRIPLNINNSSEINDSDGIVRIIPLDDYQFMVQRKLQDSWANQYSFENIDISDEDIQISNYYMSTSPKSHFIKDSFVGKFTQEGRIGLFNNQMSTRKGIKVIDKKQISFGSEWIETLQRQFNIKTDFSKEEFNRLYQK